MPKDINIEGSSSHVSNSRKIHNFMSNSKTLCLTVTLDTHAILFLIPKEYSKMKNQSVGNWLNTLYHKVKCNLHYIH